MRHKQKRIGDFGRRDVRPTYVSKPAPKAEPQTLQSWWVGTSRADLTAKARIEQARMSASKITGRVSVPDGWR